MSNCNKKGYSSLISRGMADYCQLKLDSLETIILYLLAESEKPLSKYQLHKGKTNGRQDYHSVFTKVKNLEDKGLVESYKDTSGPRSKVLVKICLLYTSPSPRD